MKRMLLLVVAFTATGLLAKPTLTFPFSMELLDHLLTVRQVKQFQDTYQEFRYSLQITIH
ncbi:MAG: hypothetical protein ACJAQ4_001004 [Cryomorphaceae bacterium]|jgi:hypothetical protein